MTPQNVPLDPLNKIKIYLKHFRTEKYFFSAMSKIFLWYFWSFEKNHISQSYAWLWFYLLFMCSMGPQLLKKYFLKFFPTLSDTLAANLVSKCQNFWLFLRKSLYLHTNQSHWVKCYPTWMHLLSTNCLCQICQIFHGQRDFKYFFNFSLKDFFFLLIDFAFLLLN